MFEQTALTKSGEYVLKQMEATKHLKLKVLWIAQAGSTWQWLTQVLPWNWYLAKIKEKLEGKRN